MDPSYKFCPRCGAELGSADHGGLLRAACATEGCGFVHWDNPTPVVAAVVEHEGHIVLARNALWTYDFYGLITGFLERNELPELAVLREVEEELGLKSREASFIGHYGFERMNQVIIAYHVKADGEIRLNEELSHYRRIAPRDVKYWPAATGLALRDWLRGKGYEPEEIERP